MLRLLSLMGFSVGTVEAPKKKPKTCASWDGPWEPLAAFARNLPADITCFLGDLP